jgi:hypothetical protein
LRNSGRQPFELHEIGKEPDADAPRRFAVDLPQYVRSAEVVVVELLVVRTGLIGDIGGGPDREDLERVVDVARDSRYRLGCCCGHGGGGGRLRWAILGKDDEDVGFDSRKMIRSGYETERSEQPRGGGHGSAGEQVHASWGRFL